MLGRLKPADGFTFMSLVAGLLAIVSAIFGKVDYAVILIVMSAVFDKLDGWIAKKTKTSNQFGMFMDSLIDICAFGMVPVVVGFIVLDWTIWYVVVAAIYVFAGAYRLARYQVEHDKQSIQFKGMPITLNALLFPLILYFGLILWPGSMANIISVFFVVSALLMVSDLKVPNW